jgi:hypothetical protein
LTLKPEPESFDHTSLPAISQQPNHLQVTN